jgi:probable rRNA maturation factor
MSLTLVWSNDQSAAQIGEELIGKLEQLLEIAGETEGIERGEVALTFVDNESIRELNRDYRGLDQPTDVLSFAMMEITEDERGMTGDMDASVGSDEADGPDELDESDEADEPDESDELDELEPEPEYADLLGDIVISVPKAIAQSEEYGHSLERELGFLFVHGFLHLIGYDHQDEASEREMFDLQEKVLHKAGLTR